jgi:hypothetical protein
MRTAQHTQDLITQSFAEDSQLFLAIPSHEQPRGQRNTEEKDGGDSMANEFR